ncbi:hypothetical protein PVAG01_04019 [Phlyctema vagabunda]|uniref:Uncharacterized protein n=1 Tax=Phlyctema vagabunda TaxID=108571 RepID=A0ABR4PN37_9HELO
MPLTSIEFVQDLSRSDMNSLTRLLACKSAAPTPEWLLKQERQLASLAPQLKRPTGLLPRLAMALDAFGPKQAYLCATHRALNPCLVRQLFVLLSAETTTRLQRLRATPPDLLSEPVRRWVRRLSSINGLWLAPDIYRAIFSPMPEDHCFSQIPHSCEACILAVVGGNPEILVDLRASIVGRRKKKGTEARLLPILNAWISWYVNDTTLLNESEDLGREIRHMRVQIQQAKRQTRRMQQDGLMEDPEERYDIRGSRTSGEDGVGEGNEKDENLEHDFEGSIIDFYANLMSTTNLVPSIHPTEGVHPAFGNSLSFEPSSNTFRRRTRPRNTAYTESAYSQVVSVSRPSIAPNFSSAEAQAHEYRQLVEIEEEPSRRSQHRDTVRQEPPPSERSLHHDLVHQEESARRDRRWTEFYRR